MPPNVAAAAWRRQGKDGGEGGLIPLDTIASSKGYEPAGKVAGSDRVRYDGSFRAAEKGPLPRRLLYCSPRLTNLSLLPLIVPARLTPPSKPDMTIVAITAAPRAAEDAFPIVVMSKARKYFLLCIVSPVVLVPSAPSHTSPWADLDGRGARSSVGPSSRMCTRPAQ